MRLRNKETGLTGKLTYMVYNIDESEREIDLTILLDNSGGECIYSQFYSLDELKEFLRDWEDYKPAEPLIKDEKIRKFVRDWATFNKIVKGSIQRIHDNSYKILGNDEEARCAWAISIHASYSETVSKDYNCDGPMIPIAELVGKEAE